MTGNETRSVALAALVVLSVVAAVPLLSGAATAAGSTTVSLAPQSTSVDVGNTTTFDVVVDPADGGVGAYNFSVSTDATVATVTDVSLAGNPSFESVDYAADNSSVEVTAAVADTNDTGAVTIATVTLTGQADGIAPVDLSVNTLGDESSTAYTFTEEDAELSVGTGGTTVSLEPGTATLSPGATETLDVVVDPADGGVGAYNFSVSTDATVATVTDVSLAGNPSFESVDYAADNSSVEVTAVGADTADTGAVTIATVTLTGENLGSTPAELTVNTLGDESSTAYDVDQTENTSLTVEEASPSISVTYEVNRTTVEPGEAVAVTATVENTGDLSGSTDVAFKTDSGTFATESVTVGANATETVTATTSFESSGTYEVSVNELPTTTVTVQQPATFDVSYEVNRTSVEPGEAVAVTATVENAGDAEGTADVAFKTNAGTFATESVTVGANATETVTATTSFESAGTYEVYVDELPATTVTVESGNPFPSGVPGISGSAAPTDTQPSNPGYEDVNGDENAGFLDAVDFLFALEEVQSQSLTPEQRNALDFNDDGEIGFLDVVELLFRV
jgi:hypothetical protein